MRVADDGDVAIMTNDSDDRVRALVRLDQFGDRSISMSAASSSRACSTTWRRRSAPSPNTSSSKASGPDFRSPFALIFLLVAMLFLVGGGLDRDRFRDAARGADQPARRRRPSGCAPAICRRACPKATRDDEFASLSRAFNRMTNQIESQQRELSRSQPPARRAPAVHRDGADRRLRRRHRARPRRPHQSAEPLGLGAARRRSRTVDRPGSRRGRAGDGGAARRGRAPARPARASAAPARPRQQHPHAAGAHRRRARRRRDQAALSSPSTTSPSCCRRSARRPGPMSRAASRTRSRTR